MLQLDVQGDVEQLNCLAISRLCNFIRVAYYPKTLGNTYNLETAAHALSWGFELANRLTSHTIFFERALRGAVNLRKDEYGCESQELGDLKKLDDIFMMVTAEPLNDESLSVLGCSWTKGVYKSNG